MAAYNKGKRTYFTIGYGKFRHKENQEILEYDGIYGVLVKIYERKSQISPGEEKTFVDFHLKDGENILIISCEKYSSNCNTILRCLPNVPDLKQEIVFEVWQGDGKDGKKHTNLVVSQNNEKIKWVDIPDKERYDLPNGEVVLSTKKREEFMDGIIKQINELLAGENVNTVNNPVEQKYADQEDVPYVPQEVDEQEVE